MDVMTLSASACAKKKELMSDLESRNWTPHDLWSRFDRRDQGWIDKKEWRDAIVFSPTYFFVLDKIILKKFCFVYLNIAEF